MSYDFGLSIKKENGSSVSDVSVTATDASVISNVTFCDIPDYISNLADTSATTDGISLDIDGSTYSSYKDIVDNIDNILNNLTDGQSSSDVSVDSSTGDSVAGTDSSVTDSSTTSTIIIEFAAETADSSAVEFGWDCLPGQSVNENTVLAHCRQKGKMLDVRSRFGGGVVRQDTDGSFGRLFGTVCSRHIIIDNATTGAEHGDGTSADVFVSDSSVTDSFSESLEKAQSAFMTVTEYIPYLLYLKLIRNYRQDRYISNGLTYTRNEPEDVFSTFINDTWKPIRQTFEDDIRALDTEENIEATGGDVSLLDILTDKILARRDRYFSDIYDLWANFDNHITFPHGHRRIDVPKNPLDDTSIFSKQMDFKLSIPDFTADDVSGYDVSTISEKCTYSDINPADSSLSLKSYFSNLSRSVGILTERNEKTLQTILSDFGNTHTGDTSVFTEIDSEISRIESFMTDCSIDYATGHISSITDDSSSPAFSTLMNNFPEYAEWPVSKTFTFDNVKYTHYVFRNTRETSPVTSNTDSSITYTDNDYKVVFGKENTSALPVSQVTSTVEISDLKYWKRYCAIATIATCVPTFWATGLVITHVQIPLPCIYTPLTVVSIKSCGLIAVIGLAIRGISINCMIIYVNVNSQCNSAMFPVTLALNAVRSLYTSKIDSLGDARNLVAATMSGSLAVSVSDMLKSNVKSMTQIANLRSLVIPFEALAIRNLRQQCGMSVMDDVVRLISTKDIQIL